MHLATLLLLLLLATTTSTASTNLRPIIGILTQPTTGSPPIVPFGHSYLVASYVKWVEAAGARVVPLPYDASTATLTALLQSLNGVLFTGGGLTLAANTTYFQTASFVFDHIIQANKDGEVFPLWGTCQGFQLLSVLVADDHSVLLENAYDSYNLPLALNLTSEAKTSRMFGEAPEEVVHTLTESKATINLHHDGVLPETYTSNRKLNAFFKLLSTNVDRKGKPFGATIEARDYPVFATQWHPERNQFEWDVPEATLHTDAAVEAMEWYARFFVRHARLSMRKFPNAQEEERALIYQYAATYTGDTSEHYPDRQTYFFNATRE